MKWIIVKYLKWRLGGFRENKPPIGFRDYSSQPLIKIIIYRAKLAFWIIENSLHRKYGKPLRDKWDKSIT